VPPPPKFTAVAWPCPCHFEPLTAEEARALLTATNGHRLSTLFELALTGGTASIRHTLQRTNSGGLASLTAKTHSSERRIALPTECLHSPEQHRDRQAQEREAPGADWKASGYVFTRPDGSPSEGATLTRHYNALLRRAALRRIRFHDIRHSAATLLLEEGVELVVIKELLGHAHIGVTATVYAHVRLRLQRDAIDLLGNGLRNPDQPATRPDDGNDPPLCAAPVR
jgi:integrase